MRVGAELQSLTRLRDIVRDVFGSLVIAEDGNPSLLARTLLTRLSGKLAEIDNRIREIELNVREVNS